MSVCHIAFYTFEHLRSNNDITDGKSTRWNFFFHFLYNSASKMSYVWVNENVCLCHSHSPALSPSLSPSLPISLSLSLFSLSIAGGQKRPWRGRTVLHRNGILRRYQGRPRAHLRISHSSIPIKKRKANRRLIIKKQQHGQKRQKICMYAYCKK